MNCHSVQNLLDLHAEGLLCARRMKTIDAHLATCEKCQESAAPAKVGSSVKSPRGLKARLASALKSAPDAAPAQKILGLSPWPSEAPALAAAALALGLVGGLIAAWGAPSQSFDAATAAVVEQP